MRGIGMGGRLVDYFLGVGIHDDIVIGVFILFRHDCCYDIMIWVAQVARLCVCRRTHSFFYNVYSLARLARVRQTYHSPAFHARMVVAYCLQLLQSASSSVGFPGIKYHAALITELHYATLCAPVWSISSCRQVYAWWVTEINRTQIYRACAFSYLASQ